LSKNKKKQLKAKQVQQPPVEAEVEVLLKNQKGIAIIMVLTAITILMAVMGDFTFETKINKLKSYNLQDKTQALLTAEAGMRLALMRLALYKEAFNYIENNKQVKEKIQMESVNQIWQVPFVFPIPVGKRMTAKQKGAITKFMKSSLLQGEMSTTIRNISNMININLIRVSAFLKKNQTTTTTPSGDDGGSGGSGDSNQDGNLNTYQEIVKLVQTTIENKSQTDDDFAGRYSGVNPEELVSIMKFYISDPFVQYDDVYKSNAEASFADLNMKAKNASMASQSELYLMPGWTDELVESIKNEITVHGNVMIDLNKITDKVLRLIIPDLDDQDIKEFFEYRDDPEDPHPFNTVNDFKNYVVSIGRWQSANEFDKRMAEFDKANIKFGTAPSLFEVISIGRFGRHTTTLTAYVSIPAKPVSAAPVDANKDTDGDGIPDVTDEDDDNDGTPDDEDDDDDNDGTPDSEEKKTEVPTQLLEPRIVEIIIK
jgi:type II secretory pathway component PulK